MIAHAVPLLVTHDGIFHADEVVGYCILRAALGLRGDDHRFVRTRDPAVIAGADIVWDVGAVLDPAAGRFDHHMRDRPVREDGTPLSSAGLLWIRYGMDAVRAWAPTSAGDEKADMETVHAEIFERIENEVIRRIDEVDTGTLPGGNLDITALVDDCNPSWDASGMSGQDAAFSIAVTAVEGFMSRRVEVMRSRAVARDIVTPAHLASADPRILELDLAMPWQEAVFQRGLPVLYAVYPAPDGVWMLATLPQEPGSFSPRMPLPEAWAGLRDADLQRESGVEDAVFVHPARFIGGAGSKNGAMELASRALEMGLDVEGVPSI